MTKKRIKSILQKSKFCFICGTDRDIEKHHIYFGPLRSISDKNGFVVCFVGSITGELKARIRIGTLI